MGMLFPLVVRRALVYGPLLLPVVLGATVAAAATASIVIYMQALRELGLEHAVATAPPRDMDLRLSFATPDVTESAYRPVVDNVHDQVMDWLGELAAGQETYARSATFLVSSEGEEAGDLSVAPRGAFHVFSDVEARFAVVSGRLPRADDAVSHGSVPLTVEAVVLEPGAQALGLTTGDTIRLTPFWEDVTPFVNVEIVGVLRVVGADAPEWREPPLSRVVAAPTLLNTLVAAVPEETLVRSLGPAFRKMDAAHTWWYDLRPERIRAADARMVADRVGILEGVLGTTAPSYSQRTALRDLLTGYDVRLRYVQVPLAVLLLLVTAMVLYAVVFLAALVVQRQRTDASLMRSRGARAVHVFLLYAAQGLLISGVSALVGPFLAAGVVSALGYLPAFSALGSGGPLTVTLSRDAFLFGALGGGMAFAVLVVPTMQVVRRSPLEDRRRAARPPQTPLLQRYYVDVGLAVVVLLLLWQLGQQGSLVAGALDGRGTTDLFFLLVPALFLLAAALLLLRLLPFGVRLVAGIVAPVAPTWLALGLWQVGRNPLDATRLVLLLVLGAGLGAFAASFGGTLERSYEDRALYQAGADARLVGVALARPGPSQDVAALVAQTPGIRDASLVLRSAGSVVSGPPDLRFSLLAVDPSTFSTVAWWRDDFADQPLSELLEMLSPDADSPSWGLPLPDDAASLGVWVRAVEPSPVTTLLALVRDANGRYFSMPLGTLESTEWTLLESPLEPERTQSFRRDTPRLEPAPPFRLLSLQVRQRARSSGMSEGAFFLDGILVRPSPGAEARSVSQFDDLSGWSILDVGALSRGDSLRVAVGAGRDGKDAALFSWGATSGFVQRGIYAGPPDVALPVLVSPGVLRRAGLREGDVTALGVGSGRVPVRIAGVVPYFPTLDPDRGAGFVVAGLEEIVRQQNLVGQQAEVQANELWVEVTPLAGPEREEALAQLQALLGSSALVEQRSLLAASRADPLVAAGWGALLFMAYGAVLFLGIVGFVAHAVLTVEERRAQFALLRTLGLGRAQIRLAVWFENLLIIGVGIGLGYLVGRRTGTLLMPFLDRTETGVAVLPPFILETSGFALGAVYAAMVGAFVLATLAVIRLYNKLALGQALRIGED